MTEREPRHEDWERLTRTEFFDKIDEMILQLETNLYQFEAQIDFWKRFKKAIYDAEENNRIVRFYYNEKTQEVNYETEKKRWGFWGD